MTPQSAPALPALALPATVALHDEKPFPFPDEPQDTPEPASVEARLKALEGLQAMPLTAEKGAHGRLSKRPGPDKGDQPSGGGAKAEGKRARSASKNARNSLLVDGAEWPKDEKGGRKKIADFTAAQKKLVLCMWEKKGKDECSRGQDCDFCHTIPDEKRKGKGKGKGGQPSGGGSKAAGKAAAAAAAAANATGAADGRKTTGGPADHAMISHLNGYGAISRLAEALAAVMPGTPTVMTAILPPWSELGEATWLPNHSPQWTRHCWGMTPAGHNMTAGGQWWTWPEQTQSAVGGPMA